MRVRSSAKHELSRQDQTQTTIDEHHKRQTQDRTSEQGSSQHPDAFHSRQDVSQVLTLSLDRQLRITSFSAHLSKLFRIGSGDIGRPLRDVASGLLSPELEDELRQAKDHGVSRDRELDDVDGRRYLARMSPDIGTDGQVDGVVVTLDELADHPRSDASIVTSEARLRAIVHASSSALFRMSADWSTLLQLTSDGLLVETSEARTDWRQTYLHPDEIEMIEAAIAASLRTTDIFELEYRVRRRDGEFGWVLGRAVPILDEDGQVLEWVGTASDVTDRRLDEDDLRSSEAHYRNLAELSPEAILVCKDQQIVFANRRAADLLGHATSDELIGRPPSDLAIPDDEKMVAATIQQVMTTGEVAGREEQRWACGDGRSIVVEVVAGPINWDGQPAVQLLASDVTDRKQTNAELRELTETLEERVEARTRQVRSLARTLTIAEQQERKRLSRLLHDDLQQLLFSVQMKVSLAHEAAQRRDIDEVLDLTARSVDRLNEAIARTRELTVDLNPPILEGEGLVEALDWLRTQMDDLHRIHVDIEAPDEVVVSEADLRILLFQIVRELLFNVAKHAETDYARVELSAHDGQAQIVVLDRGRGFDPANEDVVPSQHGLGLISARERLRMHGGDLHIESAVNRGTRAVITAPLQRETDGE